MLSRPGHLEGPRPGLYGYGAAPDADPSLLGSPARFNVAITRAQVRASSFVRLGGAWVGDRDALPFSFPSHPLLTSVPHVSPSRARVQAACVVVGHPTALLESPTWRQLLMHCAARGAWRGAGSETLPHAAPSRQASAGYDEGEEGEEGVPAAEGEEGGWGGPGPRLSAGGDGVDDVTAAVARIAELSLLGSGHAGRGAAPDGGGSWGDGGIADEGEQAFRVML